MDLESGNNFAVKVIKLAAYGNIEQAQAVAHREAKALKGLKHVRWRPLCHLLSSVAVD